MRQIGHPNQMGSPCTCEPVLLASIPATARNARDATANRACRLLLLMLMLMLLLLLERGHDAAFECLQTCRPHVCF